MKFWLSWTQKTGRIVSKLVWFENREKAEKYKAWVFKHTGITVSIRNDTY